MKVRDESAIDASGGRGGGGWGALVFSILL